MSILRDQRKKKIVEFLGQNAKATINDLKVAFSVSDATVRRDLEELSSEGRITRIRGGAAAADHSRTEPPIVQRGSVESEEKMRIGRMAAAMIREGETVFLGTGSTVVEVAKNLVHRADITVITNSLPIANLLADVPELNVIVTGGFLRGSERSLIGHLVSKSLSELRADKIIIGIQGIHPVHGLTNEYLPETLSDRAILEFAQTVIIVADHTKFGRIKSSFVAAIAPSYTIVTDAGTPPDMLAALREKGTNVVIAE